MAWQIWHVIVGGVCFSCGKPDCGPGFPGSILVTIASGECIYERVNEILLLLYLVNNSSLHLSISRNAIFSAINAVLLLFHIFAGK